MTHAELFTPRDLTELAAALRRMTPQSRLLAGGTDLVNAMSHNQITPDLIVDLSGVRELTFVRRDQDALRVGAMVTFSQLQAETLIKQHAGCLAEAAAQVGSVQIRNIATVGGNVANASPCGDSIPALMSLGAHATVLDGEGRTSSRPIHEVVIGPGATSLSPGEAIIDFTFAPLAPNVRSTFAKIGSRSAVAVARLSVGVVVEYDNGSATLSRARVAFGAVGGTAFRDTVVEESLNGQPADARTAQLFAEACVEAVQRSIPGRYSLPYKERAAVGLAFDAWNALALGERCEPVWG